MEDPVAFLRARLDEDEAAALESKNAPPGAMRFVDADRWSQSLIWLADEDRVLREVAAKRAIVARHQPRKLDRWQVCTNCRPVDLDYPDDSTVVLWPCFDLRDLASVYADHPDFKPEWAPAPASA